MNIKELSKLTDEELRVKCAELCGWKRLQPHIWEHKDSPNSVWPPSSVPNYPSDLNAMHEAEKTLSDENEKGETERMEYLYNLVRVIAGYKPGSYMHWSDLGAHSDFAMATSRQRCIAFIATKQSERQSADESTRGKGNRTASGLSQEVKPEQAL